MNKPEKIKVVLNEQLIKELGDFCHQYYLGCTFEEGEWVYAYKTEVICMLDDFFKKFLATQDE